MNVIDWLLESRNQGVKHNMLTLVLGESAESRSVRQSREAVFKTRPVADILAAQDPIGRWGKSETTLYAKYAGTYWQVFFLSELGVTGANKQARAAAEYLLSNGQTPSGAFSPNGREKGARFGLTINTLRALLSFDMYGGDKVERIIQYLIRAYRGAKGYLCPTLNHALDPRSYIVLPKVLLAMSLIPNWHERDDVRELVEDICRDILNRQVYVNVPRRQNEWVEEVRKWDLTHIEIARNSFLEEHPDALERVPNREWLEFGFPIQGRDSDMLENLRALAAAGTPDTAEITEALDQLERKRAKDGRWKLDRTLSPMLVPIEETGKPSKWITLHALYVLKHFGRWAPPRMV